MRGQFKETLLDISINDERTAVLLGDVSVYLFKEFQDKYPKRFYNLGICENTMVSAASGMSSQGFIPFVHTIAPFLIERSIEQIKLDICYNERPCNILTCGATFDYAHDGPSHNCYSDLEMLRMLPYMEIMQPGSDKEVDVLLRERYDKNTASYFRLSDFGHGIDVPVTFGKAEVLKDEGADVTVLTAGPLLKEILPACDGLPVNLVYFHTLKPLDREVLERFRGTKMLVFHDAFGLYEAACETPGLDITQYTPGDNMAHCYGHIDDIRQHYGLDTASARESIRKACG